MPDREKVIKGLEHCTRPSEVGKGGNFCMDCPYTEAIGFNQFKCNSQQMKRDALALLKEQEARIQKYEYIFDFLGIGFRQWATKILNGEAEAICETDEHEHKTVVTFKLI